MQIGDAARIVEQDGLPDGTDERGRVKRVITIESVGGTPRWGIQPPGIFFGTLTLRAVLCHDSCASLSIESVLTGQRHDQATTPCVLSGRQSQELRSASAIRSARNRSNDGF